MQRLLTRLLLVAPIVVLIAIVSFVVLNREFKGFTAAPQAAQAASSNLGVFTGYAWSENVGWISFSGSTYQVVIQNDGTLAGYAWANPSDDAAGTNNIGWISFNAADTASCGTAARLTGTAITGWAKALSADGNGWDGCISLSGSSPAYATTLANGSSQSGTLDGYAWGSDVIGWISYNCATGGPTQNNICATSNYAVTYTTNSPPPSSVTVNQFYSSPSRVRSGNPSTLFYQVTVGDSTTCSIAGSDNTNYAVTADATLHQVQTANITKNTVYTMTCGTVSATAYVGLIPTTIEK